MQELIHIQIPDNNIPERRYILDVFFSEFYGIDYEIEETGGKDIVLKFNEKRIIIKDAFFGKFPEPLSYLKKENIPEHIVFAESKFSYEKNIPVIFGEPEITVDENVIYCGIDIFASAFFMLTRWEEFLIDEKDNHGRTPDEKQFSVINNIHERAVVNEYTELLRNMSAYIGLNLINNKTYLPKITHDIDYFSRLNSLSKTLKALFGDILIRKQIKRAFSTIKSYINIKKGREDDPYETFDFLMDLSESIGETSTFYFIPAEKGEADFKYSISDKKVLSTILGIKNRGHSIGVHGAYRSYKNVKMFNEELNRFPTDFKIEEVRQHFLRFENPTTWQIAEDLRLKTDSTLSFINHVGFRTGTCYTYSVFNILTRKKLQLKEYSLIVMEQALRRTVSDENEFFKKIIELSDTVKKYKGTFVLLWHNSNFNVKEWENYIGVYKKIIRTLKKIN